MRTKKVEDKKDDKEKSTKELIELIEGVMGKVSIGGASMLEMSNIKDAMDNSAALIKIAGQCLSNMDGEYNNDLVALQAFLSTLHVKGIITINLEYEKDEEEDKK